MENYQKMAELFKMFSDVNRLKIIDELVKGEESVNNLADKLDMSVSNISQQLKMLSYKKIVKKRKEGKYAYYSLDDMHIYEIFKYGKEHINED